MSIDSMFLRGIISKVVSGVLKKKIGRKIDLAFNDLEIRVDEKVKIHLDVDAELTKEEFKELVFGGK